MRAYLIGGAITALAIASVAAGAQPAPPPPPGVAQGTAPPPMTPLPPPPPGEQRVRVMFGGDHVMTRDEVAKHVGELFARLDANHDGFIAKEEIDAFHQKFAGMAEMGRDMTERAHGMAEMGRAMAERYSHTDMPMPDRGAMFDRLDTNHDGVISRQEFMAGRPEVHDERVMIMRGPDGAPGAPPMSHPGMEMHMRHMGGMGMGTFVGEMFEMADANHDGRVSLAEAQAAALAHFDKADLNHDGRITPDERQQMHQTVRIERREG